MAVDIRTLAALCLTMCVGLVVPVNASERRDDGSLAQPDAEHVAAAGELMFQLRHESARHAARIRAAYAGDVPRLAIRNRQALSKAVDAQRIVRLEIQTAPPNIRLRLTGKHPIGEMDMRHQHLYVAARPETIGCLFDVASRVRSGALEVTSLVRHRAYQHMLARRNLNAETAVPTHAMGLAFDISILALPLTTATEIRDVLRERAAAGDLFFIGEQRQLVFHVVPAPQRRKHYATLSESVITGVRPAVGFRAPSVANSRAALDTLPLTTVPRPAGTRTVASADAIPPSIQFTIPQSVAPLQPGLLPTIADRAVGVVSGVLLAALALVIFSVPLFNVRGAARALATHQRGMDGRRVLQSFNGARRRLRDRVVSRRGAR